MIIGKSGPSGVSLARARDKPIEARLTIQEGLSPAHETRRIKEAKSFGEFGECCVQGAQMADSPRSMRRSIF